MEKEDKKKLIDALLFNLFSFLLYGSFGGLNLNSAIA